MNISDISSWPHRVVTEPQPLGSIETYRRAVAWLDIGGTIADWGGGSGYAGTLVKNSRYLLIDGDRENRFAHIVVDLRRFTCTVDCILMRHVLEHNYEWMAILTNALMSFRKRMALVTFVPYSDKETYSTRDDDQVPYLALSRGWLVAAMHRYAVSSEDVEGEHVWLLEKR